MPVIPATPDQLDCWAEMRIALWPWDDVAAHREQAESLYLAGNPERNAFIALDDGGKAIGFAEAALRRDYVEGCESSPVAFLEGVYVRPEGRKRGHARALAEAVGDWGRSIGCTEFASNALLDNVDSHAFHDAIGFSETVRVVFFRRKL